MPVFLYNGKGTIVHRLDPRVKLAGLFLAFLLASLTSDLSSMAVLSVMIIAFFLLSDSMENLLKMAMLLLLIAGASFILWSVFNNNGAGAGKFNRLEYAGVMSLRFLNMLLAGLLFLSVTSLEDFSNSLVLLKVPYAAAFAISLSFRLVNVFMAAGFMIVEAQKMRGNDTTRGPVMKRIKAYAPLLAPLILNGIKKAETLALALESKGFSPGNKIDLSGKYKMTPGDYSVIAVMLALAIAAIAFRAV